jgi:hypothetical protein
LASEVVDPAKRALLQRELPPRNENTNDSAMTPHGDWLHGLV